MTNTILVTGATGTVGREVVKHLLDKDVKIRAAVHTPSKAEKLKEQGIEVVELDYDKLETYDPALRDIDKVFFLGFANPKFAEQSKQFAEVAKKAGVKHFVKLSAYGAEIPEGEENFVVSKAHRESEKAIEETGITYTHLRPNVFMQNFINYYGQMIKDGKLYLSHGDGKVSFIDVVDVGAVAAEVLTNAGHEGKVYTLTGNKALTYGQAAEILSKALGRTITYIDIPREEAEKQMKAMGQPDFMIEVALNMADFSKSEGFSNITNTFEEIMKRKPRSFKEFAKDNAGVFE